MYTMLRANIQGTVDIPHKSIWKQKPFCFVLYSAQDFANNSKYQIEARIVAAFKACLSIIWPSSLLLQKGRMRQKC